MSELKSPQPLRFLILRRRLFIGRVEYLRALRAPAYRVLQLQDMDMELIDGSIYPTGLAARNSLCVPSLRDVEDHLVILSASTDEQQTPEDIGSSLLRSLRSIRNQDLPQETVTAMGLYALALRRCHL